MFLTIKKRHIAIAICMIVFCSVMMGVYFSLRHTFSPRTTQTIVIDAGHGGRDAGCSGINTGVSESELTLSIAKKLKNQLENMGYKVVMTRTNSDGLYAQNAKNYKKSDMEKRREIIQKANPDMVISIHLNSFPAITEKGAQVFYQKESQEGLALATSMTNQLSNLLENARKEAIGGDYYILKSAEVPSCIVEGGFLTNPDEEALLVTDEYQNKIAYAIMCGVVSYFGLNTTSAKGV